MSDGLAAQRDCLDVMEAIRHRRMHREFDSRLIPRVVLQELVWAAGRAQHARPGVRHLVIVDDPRLMKTAREVLPGYINNSTAMMVICSNLERLEEVTGLRGVEHTSRLDSGAAAAYVALAAQRFGIGTCTVTSWADSAVRSLFDLPTHVRPDITLALGYVAVTPSPTPKGGFGPAVHLNRFGDPFPREAQ